MKKYRIVSVLMIMVMLAMSAAVLSSCGSKKAETLEDYISENEDAKTDLDNIAQGIMSDAAEGAVSVKENTISVTVSLKENYDDKYKETIKESYDAAIEEHRDVYAEQVQSLEAKTDITGISLQIDVLNGDGAELTGTEITAAGGE